MLKKLLLCLLFVCCATFMSCDQYCMKSCIYEVYQKGEKLPTSYIFNTTCSFQCKDYTKDGNVYKLIDIKRIKYKDIRQ